VATSFSARHDSFGGLPRFGHACLQLEQWVLAFTGAALRALNNKNQGVTMQWAMASASMQHVPARLASPALGHIWRMTSRHWVTLAAAHIVDWNAFPLQWRVFAPWP
jgi:hypothetical protein